MNEILLRYPKVEQIALHVPDIDLHIEQLVKIGLNDWKRDQVTANGFVFGEPVKSVGNLAFNYQLGYEFELLNYVEGNNWHKAKGKDLSKPFLSHKGVHVADVETEKEYFASLGIKIAQELKTESHTSEYLRSVGRKYHYVIFDTEALFGFDLKLIKRIEQNEQTA